jgi:hypothetical protein
MAFETQSPENMAAVRAQHAKDKKGVLSSMYCSVPMGWFKNDAVYMSDEFNALGKHTQEFLKQPHVPIFEIATVSLIPQSGMHVAKSITSTLHRSSLVTMIFCQRTVTSQLWRL